MSHGFNGQYTIIYFFSYKTQFFFPSKTIKKNLDPSNKTDLDLWSCLGRVKLVLWRNFEGLILLFVVILVRGKPRLIAK